VKIIPDLQLRKDDRVGKVLPLFELLWVIRVLALILAGGGASVGAVGMNIYRGSTVKMLKEVLHEPRTEIRECDIPHEHEQQFAVPRDLRRDDGTGRHHHSKRMARAGIAPLREPLVCPRGQPI